MAKRKNSLAPLAYMGVNPTTPPQMLHHPFPPQEHDHYNVDIGAFWLVTGTDDLYVLMGLTRNAARWVLMSGDDVAGTAPVAVNIAGGVATVSLTNGANGQVLIGGGAGPAWANVTSAGGTVTIANTPNGINLEAAGVAGLVNLATDLGIAIPLAGVIMVHGGNNITTSAIGPLLTVSMLDDIVVQDLEVTNELTLSGEGTGVLVSDAAGVISSINGTDGQLLIAGTGLDPIWANVTSSDGSIVITEGPNSLGLRVSSVGGFVAPFLLRTRGITGFTTTPSYILTSVSIQQSTNTWVACDRYSDLSTAHSRIFTSLNGVNWVLTQTIPPVPSQPYIVDVHCASNGRCFALCERGTPYVSHVFYTAENPTGTWTRTTWEWPMGIAFKNALMVTYVDPYWLAWVVGLSSQPGLMWTVDPTGTTSWTSGYQFTGATLRAHASGGGMTVLVGANAFISSTADPTGVWTTRTNPFTGGYDIKDVTYSPALGMFCLVATGGNIATSTDGITWTSRINPASFGETFNCILWNPFYGLFMAIAEGTAACFYSYDGVNWYRDWKSKSSAFSKGTAVQNDTGSFGFFDTGGTFMVKT